MPAPWLLTLVAFGASWSNDQSSAPPNKQRGLYSTVNAFRRGGSRIAYTLCLTHIESCHSRVPLPTEVPPIQNDSNRRHDNANYNEDTTCIVLLWKQKLFLSFYVSHFSTSSAVSLLRKLPALLLLLWLWSFGGIDSFKWG